MVEFVHAQVGMPAAATFPVRFGSACRWVWGRSGFTGGLMDDPSIQRTLDWATVELGREGVQTVKAPRFPFLLVAAMELAVMDCELAYAHRVTAWFRLLKVYG